MSVFKPLLFCVFFHLQLEQILNDTLYFLKIIAVEFVFPCGDLYSICPIDIFIREILWPPYFLFLFLPVFPEWDFSDCPRDSLFVFEYLGFGVFFNAEGTLLFPPSCQTSVLQIARLI